MTALSRFAVRIAWMLGVLVCSAPALAETTVRVTHDRTAIWTTDFRSKVMVVRAGTTLEVVGERQEWYEVALPGDFRGKTGFVYKAYVYTNSGLATTQVSQRPADAVAQPGESSHLVGIFGFGEFGYARFAAQQSFRAVTGQGGDGFLGGGAEVRIGRGFFLNGSFNRFKDQGQRVYVSDGEVFKLGVPVTISLTPVTVTAGWRFVHEHATPYAGGGVGRLHYQEHFNFANAGEGVDGRFASYHVLGGVEFRNGWVASAFEVQYSRVPDSIGVGGASAAFQEADLGGIVARVRVLVGR
jgi:hypothetical protein